MGNALESRYEIPNHSYQLCEQNIKDLMLKRFISEFINKIVESGFKDIKYEVFILDTKNRFEDLDLDKLREFYPVDYIEGLYYDLKNFDSSMFIAKAYVK